MFYLDLFGKLQEFEVEYLLIGGLAVSLHGVERSTMDIDITVAMQPNNLDKLIACAESLGLKPVLPVPLNSLLDIPLLEKWHKEKNLQAFALRTEEIAGVTLDILLFPTVDFTDMQRRVVEFKIGSTQIKVAAIEDLISLKQSAGREIDLSDIKHLKKVQSL